MLLKNASKVLYPGRWKGLVIFIVLIALLPIVVTTQYVFTLLILLGIYSIITIGLSLLIGYAGQISIGHAAFYGIGAYMSAVLTTKFNMSAWLAIILGMMTTFLIAYFVGVRVLKLKGHILALATIAINIIVYTILNGWTEMTGGALGLGGIPKLNFLGIDLGNQVNFYYFVWIIVTLVIIFSGNLIRSNVGRILRSIHDSETGIEALGIQVSKYKVLIFAISATYASLAGSLYAHYIQFISPSTFNVPFSILLLVMVMVGGVHSIWGAMIGTVAITFLNEGIRYISHNYLHVSGEVEIIVYGFVIVVMMIFMPNGFVSLFDRFQKRNKEHESDSGLDLKPVDVKGGA